MTIQKLSQVRAGSRDTVGTLSESITVFLCPTCDHCVSIQTCITCNTCPQDELTA
jgi:hypothetical protein